MRSSYFLLVNGIIVFYLVVRIFFAARAGKITGLNFESSKSFSGLAKKSKNVRERPLNCHFQFNGETWDAFEVLGIPAGSDLQQCQRAYRDMVKSGKTAKPFLDAAWHALEDYFS